MADSGIDIRPGESGLDIVQHRPTVTGLLTGMPLAEALERIPTLLPICGNAQGIAAERAAAAARGEAEPDSDGHRQRLNREQALAAAWRLTIDWPRLWGQPPATVMPSSIAVSGHRSRTSKTMGMRRRRLTASAAAPTKRGGDVA